MILRITRKHIANANKLRKSKGYLPWSDCPVALALREAGFQSPQVGLRSIQVCGRVFRTTWRMVEFIRNFDARRKVKPARFLLRA